MIAALDTSIKYAPPATAVKFPSFSSHALLLNTSLANLLIVTPPSVIAADEPVNPKCKTLIAAALGGAVEKVKVVELTLYSPAG